jgi:hypothetical protein
VHNYCKINKVILLLIIVLVSAKTEAQIDVVEQRIINAVDSAMVDISELPDSTVQTVLLAADSISRIVVNNPRDLMINPKVYKHSANKALLFSIIPGGGQIYNKKYWKLPILYGGLMGCVYAITWNDKNYDDYMQAYFQVMMIANDQMGPNEEGNTDWQSFIPKVGVSQMTDAQLLAEAKNTSFQSRLKNRKDYFRRFRDMSIFIAAGVYALSMIDAYVDAQLFDFDISPDLSMRIEPAVNFRTPYSPSNYGFSCSVKF